ncbi:hypothetical protein [Thiohalorhabdus methylotrophus]|uniref:RING-type E3 ubiquitin transferase n=1 Tax=Thiohalorhabdus methylotrophus TaxID=3242694 RepID=A0ABV4TV06_9GAMM
MSACHGIRQAEQVSFAAQARDPLERKCPWAQSPEKGYGDWVFYLGVPLFGLSTLVFLYLIYHWLRELRGIRGARLVSANDAEEGILRIQGVLQPLQEAPLTAPFSGRSCLWYHAKIERVRFDESTSSRGPAPSWVGQSEIPAWLGDETGRALVDLGTASIPVSRKKAWLLWPGLWKLTGGRRVPAYLRELVERHELKGLVWVVEECLEPGTAIVMGPLTVADDEERASNAGVQQILSRWRNPDPAALHGIRLGVGRGGRNAHTSDDRLAALKVLTGEVAGWPAKFFSARRDCPELMVFRGGMRQVAWHYYRLALLMGFFAAITGGFLLLTLSL